MGGTICTCDWPGDGECPSHPAESGARGPRRAVAREVAQFNDLIPVGTPVLYWQALREGPGVASKTRTRAWLLGDHTPVVMVEGYPGGIALSHVCPITPAEPCDHEAEAHNLAHEVDRVRERLWRLAALAGWRPGNPADNDATAELYVTEALKSRVAQPH